MIKLREVFGNSDVVMDELRRTHDVTAGGFKIVSTVYVHSWPIEMTEEVCVMTVWVEDERQEEGRTKTPHPGQYESGAYRYFLAAMIVEG